MKDNTELRELQLLELDLLIKIDKICKENDIKYYICGGTVLGAIRHGGFIPWDDDIDIVMDRDNFNKFNKVIEKYKKIKFKSYQKNKDYYFYIPIVYNNKIDVINTSVKEEKIVHPWIDVFVMDSVSNNKLIRKIEYYRCLYYRMLINMSRSNEMIKTNKKNRPLHERILISLAMKFDFSKIINTKKVLNKLDKYLNKINKKNIKSDYYFSSMGAYKIKEIIPKSYFEEGEMYSFEGKKFCGPKNPDVYLKHFYGDYMKLPPLEERNKHGTKIIKK